MMLHCSHGWFWNEPCSKCFEEKLSRSFGSANDLEEAIHDYCIIFNHQHKLGQDLNTEPIIYGTQWWEDLARKQYQNLEWDLGGEG